jgi:hypothetical protein
MFQKIRRAIACGLIFQDSASFVNNFTALPPVVC